jgi:hypothetical protein
VASARNERSHSGQAAPRHCQGNGEGSASDPDKCPEHPDILLGVPSNASGIVGLKIAIAFMSRYAQIFQTISCRSCVVVLYLFLRFGGDGRADLDLLNRGVSVAGIAAREYLTTKRSRPEMAPQRLEKIESAPGNGMGSETSNPQDLAHGRAADRALRLTKRWAA